MSESQGPTLADQLANLSEIIDLLHETGDVQQALPRALERLLVLMRLNTGWIFLIDPIAQGRRFGPGYVLAAHHGLPVELSPDQRLPWDGPCECQRRCNAGLLEVGYNVLQCSRLAVAKIDGNPVHDATEPQREGSSPVAPAVHASAPLRAGSRSVGIINVLAPDRSALTPDALALLTHAGRQIGMAIELARLTQMMQAKHARELAAVLEFSNRLLGHGDLQELMRHLVDEVRRLLNADACALILPDSSGERLLFRAASGWREDPVAAHREVTFDEHSGPGRAMLSQRPVVTEDVTVDSHGILVPEWTTIEGFRGHCVAPLLAEGKTIGALMVDMRHAHRASDDDIRLLQLMANQAALALETARLQEESLHQERIAEQLQMARQIQLSLLPEDAPEVPGWDFAAAYRSAQIVGGDFYDYFYLPGSPLRMGVVIADVADKGVPAALFMALSRTVIRTSALGGRRPGAVLTRANSIILGDSQSDMFLTACYVTIDLTTGRCVIANGGHNRPLLWDTATEKCTELPSQGLVLGAFEEIVLEELETSLGLGDVLLLSSDGITDATDPAGESYGDERLRAALLAHTGECASDLIQSILRDIDEFTGGAAQYDDMTLVAVRRQPTAPADAIPTDWTRASFPSQHMPSYVRRRAV